MKKSEFSDVIPDEVRDRCTNGYESGQDRQWWEVCVHPPKESDNDPREVAEQLYGDLHSHGRIAYEIHSNGPDVALKVVAGDRSTAETVARHVRGEVGGRADVREASIPIDSDDPIAAAEFKIEKDVIFPLETVRTSESEVGQLHHLLDTLAAESVRGVYQVAVEPMSGDWTSRHSRALPESVPQEEDPEQEMKRAGVAMLPVFAISLALSPWPLETSVIVGCALVMAATIGDGVSVPEYWTAGGIAREYRERTKERHGARSSVSKKAEQTADEIIEQAGSRGWKASIRIAVADQNHMVAADVRDSLVAEVESSFSSSVTGQSLSATLSTGDDAREVLDHVRARDLGRPSCSEIVRRLLGKGTRRELRIGPGEFGVLGYFPGEDGGGSDAREFASQSVGSVDVPDIAPEYVRPQAVADGGTTAESEFLIAPDRTQTRTHRAFGSVETQVIEETSGDEPDDHWAGEFCRELVESSQRGGHTWLGYVEDGEQIRELGLTADQLRQHFFLVGASGAGKSTLAEILSDQYSWSGRGFSVLDPHNDLVDDILEKIPDHRKDDVIVVDPSDIDSEHTHTINFLSVEVDEYHDDYRKAVNGAVADTVGVICQGASNIGDRMEDVLYGLTRGMILADEEYTFLDMRSILRSEAERQEFADQMRAEGYQYIAEFADDLAELSRDDLAPVTRLLNKWVLSQTCRELISHTESSIDFREIIEEDKILLLRNDLADDDMQRLVATAIFKRLVRAARQRPRGERPTYPLIIDETDDIHTPEMDLGSVIGNARKFGLSLTLMTQLPKNLEDVQEELETNCKNWIVYCCPSDKQSRSISSMFGCDQDRVQSLGDYRSLIRLDIDGDRQGPFLTEMLAPMPPVRSEDEAEQEIVIPSRRGHGVKRDAGGTIEENEDEDSVLDEFLHAAVAGVEDGVLVAELAEGTDEDEAIGPHYTFIHEGTARERLRINPSRVIEEFEEVDREISVTLDEVRDHARETVDEDGSPVTSFSANSPPAGRCVGINLARISGVSRADF